MSTLFDRRAKRAMPLTMDSLPATTSATHHLQRAKAFIVDPACWTQNAFAREASGGSLSPVARRATCFCALGALSRAGFTDGPGPGHSFEAQEFLTTAARLMGYDTPAELNDTTTPKDGDTYVSAHARVMRMFDKAIQLALDAKKGTV